MCLHIEIGMYKLWTFLLLYLLTKLWCVQRTDHQRWINRPNRFLYNRSFETSEEITICEKFTYLLSVADQRSTVTWHIHSSESIGKYSSLEIVWKVFHYLTNNTTTCTVSLDSYMSGIWFIDIMSPYINSMIEWITATLEVKFVVV